MVYRDVPAVEFLTTDAESIKSQILSGYESLTGRSLAAGDPVRLFLLSIAEILILQRTAINTAAQQNLLSYATGNYLDALGTYLSVKRLAESRAKTTIRFTLSQALANPFEIPSGFEVTNGVAAFLPHHRQNQRFPPLHAAHRPQSPQSPPPS